MAIKSKDPEELKRITEDYGQFIPTEVILGGRIYYYDFEKSQINSAGNYDSVNAKIGIKAAEVGFNYSESNSESNLEFFHLNEMKLLGGEPKDPDKIEEWVESLENQDMWECIEFHNPVSIFELLPKNIHKEIFSIIG